MELNRVTELNTVTSCTLHEQESRYDWVTPLNWVKTIQADGAGQFIHESHLYDADGWVGG